MSRRRRKKTGRKHRRVAVALAALCIVLVFTLGLFAAARFEARLSLPVENAGQQLTAYQAGRSTAQYYVNGQWVTEKDTETLLVIGIDDYGSVAGSDSYNNNNQADFLVLLVRDKNTGENAAIHLNRDTMTDIPILGVTGQQAGSRRAQLALAYTYGRGEEDSCKNTVSAVSNLLYGIEIDHYITVTMDAVPILNDWAGGVTVEVLDDFTGIDDVLVQGESVTLKGQHALNYVRSRMGLEDSSNLHRMERQRQYAGTWLETAQPLFEDETAVMELIMNLSDYHYSDCTAGELTELAEIFTADQSNTVYELEGESVQGNMYMEYYVSDAAVEKLVVNLFYEPVEE